MAHLIDMSNSRANFAYVGEKAWHGLGQELTADASLDTWAVEAGLNWTIESAPALYAAGGKTISIPKQRVLYRSDTHEALSTMSTHRYKVVQPREVLDFYKDLVGHGGAFSLETAGCLDGGNKVWALARHNTEIKLGSNDVIKPYLMLVTANDGSMATTGMFTTVRVVCNNTLQMSLSADSAAAVKVPHTQMFNAVEMKSNLGLVVELERNFAAEMEALCNRPLSDVQSKEFITEMYTRRDDKNNVVNERHVELTLDKIMAILHNGPGASFETAKGTAFGFLNAITNFEDFHRRANSTESRFRSAQFGDGANQKRKALDLLLAA